MPPQNPWQQFQGMGAPNPTRQPSSNFAASPLDLGRFGDLRETPANQIMSGFQNYDWNQHPENWATSGPLNDNETNWHANVGFQDYINHFAPTMGTPTFEGLLSGWQGQNTHADRYRDDPNYRAEWDASHGNGSLLGDLFNVGVGSVLLGGLGGELFGGASAGTSGGAAGGSGAGTAGANAASIGPSLHGTGVGPGAVAGQAANASGLATGGLAAGMSPVTDMNIGGGMPSNSMLSDNLDWMLPVSSLVSGGLSYNATENAMENFEPWLEGAEFGFDQMMNFDDSQIFDSPMYQAALEEAMRATDRRNSAAGYNHSTNAMRDAANTAANMATNFGQRQFDRYATMAGYGPGAASNMANMEIAQGGGINDAIQGGIQNYMLMDLMRNNPYLAYMG